MTPRPTVQTQLKCSVEGDDIIYRVPAHYPAGFLVHVVSGWVVAAAMAAAGSFVVYLTQTSLERLLVAAFFAAFTAFAVIGAVDETWWRRVCIEGTETIALRGKLLVHAGIAYGRRREWRRRFDDVRSVAWRTKGSPGQYVSSVAVWRRLPNMFALGWGLDDDSGAWLACELATQARKRAGTTK